MFKRVCTGLRKTTDFYELWYIPKMVENAMQTISICWEVNCHSFYINSPNSIRQFFFHASNLYEKEHSEKLFHDLWLVYISINIHIIKKEINITGPVENVAEHVWLHNKRFVCFICDKFQGQPWERETFSFNEVKQYPLCKSLRNLPGVVIWIDVD